MRRGQQCVTALHYHLSSLIRAEQSISLWTVKMLYYCVVHAHRECHHAFQQLYCLKHVGHLVKQPYCFSCQSYTGRACSNTCTDLERSLMLYWVVHIRCVVSACQGSTNILML